MAAIDRSARPVDLTGGVELFQQLVMQPLPDTGLLPGPQPPPAGHPRAVAELLGKVAPRDPGVQHVQDPVERLAIIEREPTRVPETALADGDQRLDLGPQPVIDLETRRHLHDLQPSGTLPQVQGLQREPFILKQLLRDVLSIGKVGGGTGDPRYYIDNIAHGKEDYYSGRGLGPTRPNSKRGCCQAQRGRRGTPRSHQSGSSPS
jgi:hypothetical protein